MTHSQKTKLWMAQISTDLLTVSIGWLISYGVRFYLLEADKGLPPLDIYLKIIPFTAIIWLLVSQALGFYRRSERKRRATTEAVDIYYVSSAFIMCLIAFTYFYEEYRYSRLMLFIYFNVCTIFLISSRSILRKTIRIYRRKKTARKVLFWGSGLPLLKSIRAFEESNYWFREEVIGVIAPEVPKTNETYKKIENPTDWIPFLKENQVERMIIALERKEFTAEEKNIRAISNQVFDVDIFSDIGVYSQLSPSIEIIEGLPVIHVHENPLSGPGGVLKRIFDIVFSTIVIFSLAPLYLILALLVKLSSKGPVFYKQERMGIDGKSFGCLKFRSMPVSAETSSGPVWATPGEDRATWIGKILRRTSLDEIPQFINVLKGDMSVVGPRPERPVFVDQFREKVPGYMLRHKVKAGITGWAQVNGWRGDTSLERRIECDLYYIQNWTLKMDIMIILKTFREVIYSKNAY